MKTNVSFKDIKKKFRFIKCQEIECDRCSKIIILSDCIYVPKNKKNNNNLHLCEKCYNRIN